MEQNEYDLLIEKVEQIIAVLEDKQSNLNKDKQSCQLERQGMMREISQLDSAIGDRNDILTVLKNYKKIIKNICKSLALPTVSIYVFTLIIISAILAPLDESLIFLVGVPGSLLSSATFFRIRFLEKVKKFQNIKARNKVDDVLEDIRNFEETICIREKSLTESKEKESELTESLREVNDELLKFQGYRYALRYGRTLASDLSLGRANEIDRIFFYDRRAQEIQKLVREKVEKQ